MTLRRPEIQLAVHLPATGIYLGPKDRADVLGGRERPQRHRGIYLHPFSSLPRVLFAPSFSLPPGRWQPSAETDATYRIFQDTVRVVEPSGEPDGGFGSRACRKQFRNFPPWLCHLRFAIRLGEIEFSQVETGGASVVGTASSAASTSTCLRRIFRIASPVRHLLPSAS